MPTTTIRKNKVVLSDYNYQRDIENRLLIAELTVFEVDVLREILDGSLKFSIKHLAQNLNAPEDKIHKVLTKLSKSKLFQKQGDTLLVDKEMRKYYEHQILKFDEEFKPGMEYLQSLIGKVPQNILPNWYQLPRTSDNIFHSIVEKYFLTPKVYEKYLAEVYFDDPNLNHIMKEIHNAPEGILCVKNLLDSMNLSRERFEEYMLLLEYNFVGCLTYYKHDDTWWEVIRVFNEWAEYKQYIKENTPKTITDLKKIQRTHENDFGYLMDLNLLLKAIAKKPLKNPKPKDAALLDKLQLLHLVESRGNQFYASECAEEWLNMSLPDQALALYRHEANKLDIAEQYNDRDLRQIEKSLKNFAFNGWILLEDFKKGFVRPLGKAEVVTLKCKGKRWKYVLPSYTEDDFKLIDKVILNRLYETGMVATGTYKGELCFAVTAFGCIALSE